MFNLLFFVIIVIAVFALAIVMSILNAVLGIFRGIFSFGRKGDNTQPTSNNASSPAKKKVFDTNDGEYVDYEEVK
jgi:hypothetical protein